MNRFSALFAFGSLILLGSQHAFASPVPFAAETITFSCPNVTGTACPTKASQKFSEFDTQGFSFTQVSGGDVYINTYQGGPSPSISVNSAGSVLQMTNTSGESFVLNSLDLAAQQTNNVTITGLFGNTVVFTDQLSVTGSYPTDCPGTGFCYTEFDLTGANLAPVTAIDISFAAGNKFYLDNLAVSPAPEPDSLLLLGTGLLTACGGFYRRLRQAAA